MTIYDWCLRINKVGMFVGATTFSSATSFFCNEPAPPLSAISASSFTCAAMYSLGKHLGVAKDIERQVKLNEQLKDDVTDILRGAQALNDLVKLPDRIVLSAPTHPCSREAMGFNQFTNAAVALVAIFITWLASYDEIDGHQAETMVTAAVAFVLMHMICARYLRQVMNQLVIESEVLTQQGLGLAHFAKGDIQRAWTLLRDADQLAEKIPGLRQAVGERLSRATLLQAHRNDRDQLMNHLQDRSSRLRALLARANHANWRLCDTVEDHEVELRRLRQYVRHLRRSLRITVNENDALNDQLDRQVMANTTLSEILSDRDLELDYLASRCHRLREQNRRLMTRYQDDETDIIIRVSGFLVPLDHEVWVEEVDDKSESYHELHIA